MDPVEPSDAQAAYTVQRALVELRLEELRAALDAHEAVRPLRCDHVGTLKLVEARITEIVAFLG